MLNKTPKPAAEKTKLAHRRWLILIAVALVVGVSGYAVHLWSRASSNFKHDTCLNVNNHCSVKLEVADTESERVRGLSGRSIMADDQGMLFIFLANPQIECFWMKDMNFSLDILWMDENMRVTKLEKAVSPSTYPSQFCSDEPTRYVVELTAGSADRLGLKLGDTLNF